MMDQGPYEWRDDGGEVAGPGAITGSAGGGASSRSGGLGARPRGYNRSFLQFYNSRYGWSDTLIDCLTIAGMGTRFARGWRNMAAKEMTIFTAYICLVLAHMLWRYLRRASYSRWRHITGTGFTMLATCTPRFWRRRVLGLHRPFNPPEGGSALQRFAIAVRLVLVNSYTLQLTVYGIGRPAPLWLKLPTHAASVAVAVSNVRALCATPVFAHPAISSVLRASYQSLRAVTELLPMPASRLLPDAGEAGSCRAVVVFVHLTLGFVFPMLVSAAMELRARQLHARQSREYWHYWHRQLKHRSGWRFVSWIASGRQLFHSWVGDLAAVLLVAAALWDISLALSGSDQDAALL